MNKPNYASMTRQELRDYIIKYQEDKEAFHFYIDKFKSENAEIYPAPQTIEDLAYFPEVLEKHRKKKIQ